MRGERRKLPRVLLALFLGLVLCELGLRTAGWVYLRATSREGATGRSEGEVVLACIGDSNVFGLYEAAKDTYPARLQHLLDDRQSEVRYRVLNLGRPGDSTADVLQRLPDELEKHHPELLILTTGVNDNWAWTLPANATSVDPPWYEELRLLKVLRLVALRFSNDEPEPDPAAPTKAAGEPLRADRGRVLALGERRDSTTRALELIAACTERAGSTLVIAGYASNDGAYGRANEISSDVAASLDLPFVDVSGPVEQLVGRIGWSKVFVPDRHPRAVGYEVVARQVHDELVRLGRVAGVPFEDALEGVVETARSDAAPLEIRITGDPEAAPGCGDELAILACGGEPGSAFLLQIWGHHRAEDGQAAEDVLADPMALAMKHRTPRLTFDAGGSGRYVLPLEMLGPDPRGLRFWVICLPVERDADGRVQELGEPQLLEIL